MNVNTSQQGYMRFLCPVNTFKIIFFQVLFCGLCLGMTYAQNDFNVTYDPEDFVPGQSTLSMVVHIPASNSIGPSGFFDLTIPYSGFRIDSESQMELDFTGSSICTDYTCSYSILNDDANQRLQVQITLPTGTSATASGFLVRIDGIISIEDFPQIWTGVSTGKVASSVVVYPNPAKDLVHISNAKNLSQWKVEILNSVGETVMRSSASKSQKTLNISVLPAGYYTLKVHSSTGMDAVRKLIVLD